MPYDPRGLLRLGAIANMILAAAMATAWAYSQRMFGTADEAAHLDYAYQVWQGRLPIFENGLVIEQTFGVRPPVQWTSQHPPLFYVLQAPFVGPLIDADQLLAAGYAGRAVNAIFSLALVAAVMWAASAIAPGRNTLWMAAGTVTALYPLVVQLGGLFYNDNLFAMWTALLVGLTARMLRREPSVQRLVLFGLVAACALMTRFAAAPTIAVCATTLGVALLLRRPRSWRAIAGLAGTVAFAVATSAWFYLRNLRLSGNLTGGHFDYLEHRIRRPLLEVVLRREVWDQLWVIHGYNMLNPWHATFLLVGLPFAVACVVGIVQISHRRRWLPEVALAVLLTGLLGTVLLMQLTYVSAGGGASKRYLAPITILLAFAIAAGLTAARRMAPLLLSVWCALEFIPFAGFVIASLGTPSRWSTAPVFPVPTVLALVVAGAALIAALGAQVATARRAAAGTPTTPEPRSPAVTAR